MKITPTIIASTDLTAIINLPIVYCEDRSAPYRATGSVNIPVNTIMSVPNS
jgi:hypothetical protein